jgi:hypothetical protein
MTGADTIVTIPAYMKYQLCLEQEKLLRVGGGWWKSIQDLLGVNIDGWCSSVEILKTAWIQRNMQHASGKNIDYESNECSEEVSVKDLLADLYELELDQLAAEYNTISL